MRWLRCFCPEGIYATPRLASFATRRRVKLELRSLTGAAEAISQSKSKCQSKKQEKTREG